MRLGIDVGGTNTDAVLVAGRTVLAAAKRPTTKDVSSGIVSVTRAVLEQASEGATAIESVMVGTTHFANAFVERKGLLHVGVLRLAGASGEALPPLSGWPDDLRSSMGATSFQLPGGYEFNGLENTSFDEQAVREAARKLRKAGIESVAISCVFAPINRTMEDRAAAIVKQELPEASVTVSGAVGRIGFLERENATIMNAALAKMAGHVMSSFTAAFAELGIRAPLYVSQNDGTLISASYAAKYPVLTFGSGPTNSMRGAAFLTGLQDAIVMDVGGTTTDIGALVNGFPRESSIAVNIGGVRTNFRMPDILSLGLGGGTRIHRDGKGQLMRIGPDSVGYRLLEDACLFGGSTLTTSDVAVKAGLASFGDVSRVPDLPRSVMEDILLRLRRMFEDGIDRMNTAAAEVPVVLVGGGSVLVPQNLKGASRVVRPDHAAVANAVGAAIAQVGGEADRIVSYEKQSRDQVMQSIEREATDRAIAAGAAPKSVKLVDMEEVFLSYLPGNAAQIRAKVVGDLAEVACAR
jgi:N-methylhydantoinase A/oxoprolinase/acetone carboxylase beta subunit